MGTDCPLRESIINKNSKSNFDLPLKEDLTETLIMSTSNFDTSKKFTALNVDHDGGDTSRGDRKAVSGGERRGRSRGKGAMTIEKRFDLLVEEPSRCKQS